MNDEEMVERILHVEQEGKTTQERLGHLENDHDALARMATAIEVLATKQQAISDRIEVMEHQLDELEHVHGGQWKHVLGYLAAAILSAGSLWLVEQGPQLML